MQHGRKKIIFIVLVLTELKNDSVAATSISRRNSVLSPPTPPPHIPAGDKHVMYVMGDSVRNVLFKTKPNYSQIMVQKMELGTNPFLFNRLSQPLP